jgi:hypothetical protein
VDGHDGFLVPYHDYLVSTGDPIEDERRRALMGEIAVSVEAADMPAFSYAAELASADVAISMIARSLDSVRKVREHGIAKGPWELREEWLNAQLAAAWKDRGTFPGLGSALEAFGLRLGTALVYDLTVARKLPPDQDPWPVIDALMKGKETPPRREFAADIKARVKDWTALKGDRLALLHLLSRFDLSPAQAVRWYDERKRGDCTSCDVADATVLQNPYRIAETDLGDADDWAVPLEVIDRGMLPDSTIAAKHPMPEPSRVESVHDPRRVRAALVTVLRRASSNGDTLLSDGEAVQRIEDLKLARPLTMPPGWLASHADELSEDARVFDIPADPSGRRPAFAAVQLRALWDSESALRKVLTARADKSLPSVEADWKRLLVDAISHAGGKVDPKKRRHAAALEEQATALERITTRKLSVLVGKAGTGKTSILGALLRCQPIVRNGILLLAPTGKARVKLGKAAGGDTQAMTVAQFLYSLGRYDHIRQRPLLQSRAKKDSGKYAKEKTIVIDESSMLTLDDLHAVVEALDLGHVQRLIFVGDPNQLPPIGMGRPFADLVLMLDEAPSPRNGALARLTVELRTRKEDEPSDALRLASWFTREPQPIDADEVLSKVEKNSPLNDLSICFWSTAEELRSRLLEQMQCHTKLKGPWDVSGFNATLGLSDKGRVEFEKPDGVDNFQILSPVRMHLHGVQELNRWVQRRFRAEELKKARETPWAVRLGDEEIVISDKVIQLTNRRTKGYDWKTRTPNEVYLANGEIGVVGPGQSGFLNVAFSGRPNVTVGYRRSNFGDRSPLELAYAITVHKAQGSEFETVFVVVPKNCRLLTRELLYTAITRSRQQLVLFVEGKDASLLYELTKPEASETARRNTNLFAPVLRAPGDDVPYAEHLIHRTHKGHMVRSKSELVIANELHHLGIPYQYERPYEGSVDSSKVWPDFTFIDPAGELLIWEHLGMLSVAEYSEAWDRKRAWYKSNGFSPEQENLFTTKDDERGGLDSAAIRKIALRVKERL